MHNNFKISVLWAVMSFTMLLAFADRGISKKSKAKVKLNVTTSGNFKKALSLNLKSGLRYKGSLIANIPSKTNNFATTLVTYQKGNTTYILPYKQKIFVSEIKQGYSGWKLIIKAP